MNAAAKRWRPVFAHLDALTDGHGFGEQAEARSPGCPRGYHLDDAARALIVTCREPQADPLVDRLERCYLRFVVEALRQDGTFHNGKGVDGRWLGEPDTGDGWGRAVWALGVAAADAHSAGRRAQALSAFRVAAQHRSSAPRAMIFAGLGAGALLRCRSSEPAALGLMQDAAATVGPNGAAREWPWPEPRLGYANGALAEVLLVAGDVLRDKAVRGRGLDLLAFLLRVETRDGRLCPTDTDPAPDEPHEQPPSEVAALADACATAYRLTGDPRWLAGVNLAWRWFLGDNDSGVAMFDATTGAGYDGAGGADRSRQPSAASTLAMLSTAQHARRTHELR